MDDYEKRVRALGDAKAFAVASYGESVAAYRYRTLSEKATSAAAGKIFTEMAEEEQGHHRVIQDLIRQRFTGSDFVLSTQDKELVIVGPRMFDLSTRDAYDKALEMIYESERLTGRLYAVLHAASTDETLRPMLKEMADECVEHAERLKRLPPAD